MSETMMLRPADATWLADTFARNRARWGGLVMELGANEGSGSEPAEPAAQETTNEKADTPPAELGDAGKKALQAERAARAEAERRAAALEARVKEFEDANKTQAERDAEARADLERTAAANAAKVLRYEVAEKAGLPLSAAGRLQGDTEEALLQDAEALKELLKGVGGAERPPTPKPDKSQGAAGGAPTPSNLMDAISGHYNT